MLASRSRAAVATANSRPKPRLAPRPAPRSGLSARRVALRASSGGSSGGDFDQLLIDIANKFEKADNKPAIVGWSVAAVFAIFTAEWLIHLPVLDVLLGFFVQLVGLFALPYLGIRWFMDGGDIGKDAETYVASITKKLPGLDK